MTQENPIFTVYRLLTYVGPREELEQTFASSGVPLNGSYGPQPSKGFNISSVTFRYVNTDMTEWLCRMRKLIQDVRWCEDDPESLAAALTKELLKFPHAFDEAAKVELLTYMTKAERERNHD